jgi:hypothetical protein
MDDDRRELTLTLHGLDAYNRDVDGEVFARKVTAFLKGVRLSDKAVNGQRRHKLLLTDLRKNTATISIREQVYVRGPPPGSGMAYYEAAVEAVYHKRPDAKNLPLGVVKEIASLNNGSGHSFDFGEIKSSAGTVIRIDDYLSRIAKSLVEEMETERQTATARFRGTAFGSFDGVLELADFRGRIWKGALKLTAGNKEIECTIDALAVPEIKDALKCRVVAYGLAHYNGRSGLPDRLEVISAKPIPAPDASDLGRWRGAFELAADDTAEGWD